MTIPGSNWEAVTMMINISTRPTALLFGPKLSEAVQKPKI
jgi:hypothetical protein